MAKLNVGELEEHVDKWLYVVVPFDGRHFACVRGGRLRKLKEKFYIYHSESPIEIDDKTSVYLSAGEAAEAAGLNQE